MCFLPVLKCSIVLSYSMPFFFLSHSHPDAPRYAIRKPSEAAMQKVRHNDVSRNAEELMLASCSAKLIPDLLNEFLRVGQLRVRLHGHEVQGTGDATLQRLPEIVAER